MGSSSGSSAAEADTDPPSVAVVSDGRPRTAGGSAMKRRLPREARGPREPRRPAAAEHLAASPDSALRVHGIALARMLSGHAPTPARWATPAFSRKVLEVLAHLRPIHSRTTLAASYAREAGRATPRSGTRDGAPERALAASAVEVAYALRWLQLDDGSPAVTWPWNPAELSRILAPG